MQGINKARGVLLGNAIGDAIGGTLEFSSKESNYSRYPRGLRDVVGGGPFSLRPGQITDDTELALALARSLVQHGLDFSKIAQAYVAWKRSPPFDCGGTCGAAFGGQYCHNKKIEEITQVDLMKNARHDSQANGSLMRVSPLAIFGHALPPNRLAQLAAGEAQLSHPNMVCQVSNGCFVLAIRKGIQGGTREEMFSAAWHHALAYKKITPTVYETITKAKRGEKVDTSRNMGWVLVALQHAFYELKCGKNFEDSLVDVVMAGGDTDTNGAIAGALLGAAYGIKGIPKRWIKTVLECKSPRPQTYHCNDLLDLAVKLYVQGGDLANPIL